jgi:DNA primase
MAGRIPQNFIDDLISRLDIIDVVSARTRLKKAGKNYSACCPFHNEKTPSFTVSPDKQFYYCFGCGATGSALKFVMEFDGLEFPDAVEKLAGDLNIEVPREGSSQQNREPQYRELHALTQKAADFFEQQLRTSKDKDKAISYLKDRGLSGKAAKFFSIGYAPPGWDNLQNTLAPGEKNDSTNNKTIKQLISCGMTIEKEDGRTYDRFRDRVMFPIRNVKGQVIAFGGRVLGDEKPKYLNSPETPIFHKGQELYGLYEARKIRQKLTRMIIVEGYMDVVALAEYGIHYAVATLGTSTSEHHIRRLFKVVPEIIFCFDGDNAGRKAALRAMETVIPALQDGLQARFLFLPDGEDPDTIVRKEGKEAFEKRLDNSKGFSEFLFDNIKAEVDFDTLDGKARFGKKAAPLIARLPKGLLKEIMSNSLAQETGIERSILEELLPQEVEKPNQHRVVENATPYTEPNHQPHDNINDTHYYDNDHEQDYDVSHFIDADNSTSSPSITPTTRFSNKEDEQLAAHIQKALTWIVKHPENAQRIDITNDFEPESEPEQLLLEILKSLKKNPQNSCIGLLISWTATPFVEQLKDLASPKLEQLPDVDFSHHIQAIINTLQERPLKRELQKLSLIIHNAKSPKDISKEDSYRYHVLKRQFKKIK